MDKAMDVRSTWLGGTSRISPSPSKNAPVTRPSTVWLKAMVPLFKVM